jgi:osmotically-inducible protein OsmY
MMLCVHWKFINGYRYLTSLVLLLFSATMLVSAEGAQAADTITDLMITDAVEDEMTLDSFVPLANIDIFAQDGIVTLSGSVDSLLKKRRAARIAETVRGVRSVVNQIIVTPPVLRTDADIRQDVVDALLSDPVTESYEIDVSVRSNKVTLTGVVDSWQERKLSETVASAVRGVAAVANNIAVDYASERPEHAILTEIEQALRWERSFASLEAAEGAAGWRPRCFRGQPTNHE